MSSVDSSSSVDVTRVVVGSEPTVAAEFVGSLAATVAVVAGSADLLGAAFVAVGGSDSVSPEPSAVAGWQPLAAGSNAVAVLRVVAVVVAAAGCSAVEAR